MRVEPVHWMDAAGDISARRPVTSAGDRRGSATQRWRNDAGPVHAADPRATGTYPSSIVRWSRTTSIGAFRRKRFSRVTGLDPIDPQHRWHFVWEGTGRALFPHSTQTATGSSAGGSTTSLRPASVDSHRLKDQSHPGDGAQIANLDYGEPVSGRTNWTSFTTPGLREIRASTSSGGRAAIRPWLGQPQSRSLCRSSPALRHDTRASTTAGSTCPTGRFERALRFARDRDVPSRSFWI